MPNWCENDMAVYGPKEDVKRFIRAIMDIDEKASSEGVWFTWKAYEELTGKDPGKAENYIRGSLCCISEKAEPLDDGQGVAYVSYDSAWASMDEGWDEILAKSFPTLKQVTRAYEPGCEYAINTDREGRFFPERLLVDGSDDDAGSVNDWFWDEKNALAAIKDLFGETFKSLNDFSKYCKSHDGYCSVIRL